VMADAKVTEAAKMIKVLGCIFGGGLILAGIFFLVMTFDPGWGNPICAVIGLVFLIPGIVVVCMVVSYTWRIKEQVEEQSPVVWED